MPMYRYVARDWEGQPFRGTVAASELSAAKESLRRQGLYVTDIADTRESGGLLGAIRGLFGRKADTSSHVNGPTA